MLQCFSGLNCDDCRGTEWDIAESMFTMFLGNEKGRKNVLDA